MTKTEPDFPFLSREGNKELYRREESLMERILIVAKWRAKRYGEDLWHCAVAEVVYTILDNMDQKAVEKAVMHWIRVQHSEVSGYALEGASAEQIRALLGLKEA